MNSDAQPLGNRKREDDEGDDDESGSPEPKKPRNPFTEMRERSAGELLSASSGMARVNLGGEGTQEDPRNILSSFLLGKLDSFDLQGMNGSAPVEPTEEVAPGRSLDILLEDSIVAESHGAVKESATTEMEAEKQAHPSDVPPLKDPEKLCIILITTHGRTTDPPDSMRDDWLSYFKFIEQNIYQNNKAEIIKVNAAAVGTVNFTGEKEVEAWRGKLEQLMATWCEAASEKIIKIITNQIKELASLLSPAYKKVLEARNPEEWMNIESLKGSMASAQMSGDVDNFWYQNPFGYGIDNFPTSSDLDPQMVEKTYTIGDLKEDGITYLGDIEYLCCGSRTWKPLFGNWGKDDKSKTTTSEIITRINTLQMKKVVILDYSCTVLSPLQERNFNTQSQIEVLAGKFYKSMTPVDDEASRSIIKSPSSRSGGGE
jgi:hypothetical protein